MGFEINNERTTALVPEFAKRMGLSQTGAILDAVRATLAGLDGDAIDVGANRRRENAQQLLNQLHNSFTDAERAELKVAESQLYDDAGLPS